jgi:rhodanese-related sulfurtransferase
MNMYGIKELDVDTLQSYLQEGKVLRLLDVRGIAEMEQGMIPNAEKLPLHTLPARLHEIDDDELTVLYCRSGARSAQGVGFMAQQGFDNVYNLRGGIIAWAQKGMPLTA